MIELILSNNKIEIFKLYTDYTLIHIIYKKADIYLSKIMRDFIYV